MTLSSDSRAPHLAVGDDVQIHRSAEIGAHVVIHGRSRIGAGCVIGDHAIIGKPALLARSSLAGGAGGATTVLAEGVVLEPYARVYQGACVGARTHLEGHAQVRERASVGSDCRLGHFASVTFDASVGDRVVIGAFTGIAAPVRVDDDAWIGARVTCTNDDAMARGDVRLDGAHFGARCVVGSGSVLLPGTRIGCGARVAPGARVTREVPDFGVVAGVPARAVAT